MKEELIKLWGEFCNYLDYNNYKDEDDATFENFIFWLINGFIRK